MLYQRRYKITSLPSRTTVSLGRILSIMGTPQVLGTTGM
jgi:hypothetical protein